MVLANDQAVAGVDEGLNSCIVSILPRVSSGNGSVSQELSQQGKRDYEGMMGLESMLVLVEVSLA